MRRYLLILLSIIVATIAVYFGCALCLTPARVKAEYWVHQSIVVKRSIAAAHRGQQKVIVAGGSSVLFGVDTKQLGDLLNVPAINLGLHAALQLRTILAEAEAACEPGDTLVLALEPGLFAVNGLSAWQSRNMIAWEPESWAALPIATRIKAIGKLGPDFLMELLTNRLELKSNPAALRDRILSMDDERTLACFHSAPSPTSFAYSPNQLDSLGNMQMIDGAACRAEPRSAETVIEISRQSWRLLSACILRVRAKGVVVYFANCPWMDNGRLNRVRVAVVSKKFREDLRPLAPVLDELGEVVFPRAAFFDTALHLNTEGRKVRTRLLADAMIRNGVLVNAVKQK